MDKGKLFAFNFQEVLESPKEHYDLHYSQIEDLLMQKFLVLDLEATGLNCHEDHITEAAFVPVVNGVVQADRLWSTYVRTSKNIPPEISDLTGVTNAHTAKGIQAIEILNKISEEFFDHIWVGQCAYEFDFPMLESLYSKYSKKGIRLRTTDTKILYAALHPEIKLTFSTSFLAEQFKLDRAKYKRHSAAGDALLIAHILVNILKLYRSSGQNSLSIEKPLRIKKFIPTPLL